MVVKLSEITKIYRTHSATIKALDCVNLEFDGAGLVMVTGENGCGKSTLLNIIGGLDKPTSGQVEIAKSAGKNSLKDRADKISYIFQTSNLIGTLTVKQNIKLVARAGEDIDKVIDKVGLRELADRYPNELSIGQQQRACIARAIVKDDAILLADEPTSSLDPQMRKEIASLLSELAKDRLVIVVTHYPEDFEKVDRRIAMQSGKIISDDTIEKARECRENKKREKRKGNILPVLQSTATRTKKHFFRFLINFLMLFIGFVCIIINQNVFSYANDDNSVYRQVLANNEILVKTDDYTALGNSVKPIYRNYYWNDFQDIIKSKYTDNLNKVQSDYYKAYMFYDPYFMDITSIGDKELVAGRMPKAQDEIVINKYLADMYIEYYAKEKLYNYEDVVSKAILTTHDYGLSVQQNPVFRIVGITDDDLSAFEALKSCSTQAHDLMRYSSGTKDETPDDGIILFYEFAEWLNVGGGAVYAMDYGKEANSVNGYYNSEIEWISEKNNISAMQGSGIINYDYESADWLNDVEIYGTTQGAVVNFDSLSDISYRELCEKYANNAQDIQREINYVLDKFNGTPLYFSMRYMSLEDSIFDITDPFRDTYYFDTTVAITGIYIPDDKYFTQGGVFSQQENVSIRKSVILLNEQNYKTLNALYNTPPECGLALLDVGNLKSSDEVKEFIDSNDSILQINYIGEYVMKVFSDRISIVNIVALSVGIAMLLFSLIFVLYSLSQYFKQHSGDLGILMSLGKGKGFCSLFILGEYLFMILLSFLLSVPTVYVVPMVLTKLISSVATSVNVFIPSAISLLYILMYIALVLIMAIIGVFIGLTKKTPIERIKDSR